MAKHVDLVLEFQVEEAVAPRVAHIFKKADIPLVAIDVPHPNSTYFGVDNFEVGYEAGVPARPIRPAQVEGQSGLGSGRGIH